MYCPNCGNENSEAQNFCRSCGLGLEKIAQSLTEQLPTKTARTLQQQKERLERLGVLALSVFGVGILGFILYSAFYKLLLTQGKLIASLILLALIVIMGCGLLSVILFAKAKEVKEASTKRQIQESGEMLQSESTGKLLDSHPQPIFSVAERTTELLSAETQVKRD